MPARSKSQQRLFGMVHAYNKGEFHGSRALRRRVAALSRHISDEDAKDFAKTPHDGLPEKKAQVSVRPEVVQELYGRVPPAVYAVAPNYRSRRRRSFLGRVVSGTIAGTLVGGLGAGGLGALVANRTARDTPGVSPDAVNAHTLDGALRLGLWGAPRGAAVGAAVGAGLGILDKIRG